MVDLVFTTEQKINDFNDLSNESCDDDFSVGFIKVMILNQIDHNVIAPSIIRDCRDGFYTFTGYADPIRVPWTQKPTVSHLVMGT